MTIGSWVGQYCLFSFMIPSRDKQHGTHTAFLSSCFAHREGNQGIDFPQHPCQLGTRVTSHSLSLVHFLLLFPAFVLARATLERREGRFFAFPLFFCPETSRIPHNSTYSQVSRVVSFATFIIFALRHHFHQYHIGWVRGF